MDRSFSEKVYSVVRKIPPGKVMTYGQVAKKVGKTGAARAVGNALHHNPDPKTIPCHRVVNKEGRLAPGFGFGGSTEQRRGLLKEGVEFKDKKHVDLDKCKHQISKIKMTF